MKFLPFGNFESLCRDSPLPVCNLMNIHKQHPIVGIHGKVVIGDIGSALIDVCAIAVTALLITRANKRPAAVGRREFQMFLGLYALVSLCDIFTTGRFLDPFSGVPRRVLLAFSSVQTAAITATFWALFLNAIVSLQFMVDGTRRSISLVAGSSLVVFGITVLVAAITGFSSNNAFQTSKSVNAALYILYIILPLLFAISYVALNIVVVLKTLHDPPAIWYLAIPTVLFAIGQVIEFVANKYISTATHGAVDSALFQTLFTLAAIIALWFYWNRITEDGWPIALSEHVSPSGLESLFVDVRCVLGTPTPKPPQPPSIKISRHISMSMEQSLDALERHKNAFLSDVEREVRELVESSDRLNITSIIATSQTGSRTVKMTQYTRRAWTRRFIRMARHESTSLPTFDGEILDSWLTEPIMTVVNNVRTRFLQTYSHIVCQSVVGMLKDSPMTQREFARQFTQHLQTNASPLSPDSTRALRHLLQNHLSAQPMDRLSLQLGRHLTRQSALSLTLLPRPSVADSRTAAFSAALVPAVRIALRRRVDADPALAAALATTTPKPPLVSASAKAISKAVTSALVAQIISTRPSSSGGGAGGGLGGVLSGSASARGSISGVGSSASGHHLTGGAVWAMTLPTATLFDAVAADGFEGRVAERIAGLVKGAAGEEFRRDNRNALRLVFKEVFKDGGKRLCEDVLEVREGDEEKGVMELAREAAEEMVRAAGTEGIVFGGVD